MSILVDTQFKNITANFKPEFGNEKHIAVLGLFQRLKNLEDIIQSLEDKKKTSKAIKNEIEETKKRIIRLLEQ